jgi:hypothetical protein
MKVGQDFFNNTTSFLGVEKDLRLICKKLMENQTLMKLLYYSEKDCLKGTKLTME